MRLIYCFLFSLLFSFNLLAQQDEEPILKPFSVDLVMGPYLILDGTIYESVFLRGIQIGKEFPSGFAIGLEYIAGHQEDLAGQLGTTHSAFGTFKYYTKKQYDPHRFRWYGLGGGGFFEFKDFSADVLGVAFYAGVGLEMNLHPMVKAFAEQRYINLGLMDANGTHQFGVMWGIRGRF